MSGVITTRHIFLCFLFVACGEEKQINCDFHINNFCIQTNNLEIEQQDIQLILDISFRMFFEKHPELSEDIIRNEINNNQIQFLSYPSLGAIPRKYGSV